MSAKLKQERHQYVRRIWLIGIFFSIGVLLFAFAVPLVAPCWHATHDNKVTYNDWVIHVPEGFFPASHNAIWKLSLGTPFFRVPYGHISLFQRRQPTDLSKDYPAFENAIVQEGSQSGLHVSSRRQLLIDGKEGRCIEMSGAQTSEVKVRCMISGDRTVIFYEGYSQYLSDFYTVLQKMKQEKGAA